MRTLLLVAFLTGCASSPWQRANCARMRYPKYNILACDDNAVGRYCHDGKQMTVSGHRMRLTPTADDGTPVDYYPRACAHSMGEGRKTNVFIGRSYLNCLAHELCHVEYPADPAMCEEKYPCL